jgi:methylmalonyl-CoA/ethylmalonyl-CoA epimerase
MELPEQGIRIAYVGLGNAKLELMEPLGSSSPISKFLENHPEGGLHHFCLTTNDVSEAAATANNSGMRILGGDTLTIGHHGKKLFFIHPKDTLGSLIEIEETLAKDN